MRKKVLLIDDDAVLSRLFSVRLRGAGYDVAVACDGVQSISAVHRERPDVIRLDIGVVVSGRAAETDAERMLAAGADDYFQKPVDLDRLAATA